MRRRDFLTVAGGAAAFAPLAARTQQASMPVIGLLFSGTPEAFVNDKTQFERGLKEVGYVDGKNVTIEYRFASGEYDKLPALARELVDRKVDVIVTAGGEPAAIAAKAATSTIPIVFGIGGDPVRAGLVVSLARPGGNATGASLLTPGLERKRLEVLHELLPTTMTIAVLVNPNNQLAKLQIDEVQEAARIIPTRLLVLNAGDDQGLEAAFATLIQKGVKALVVTVDPFFYSRRKQLALITAKLEVPTIFGFREFAFDGGLMSYGTSPTYSTGIIARYADRILNGEKPADLPVQQVTEVQLILNLKTAKALGISFPITLLGRADEVIE